jgi:RNA polymerase sigma-70 factor (ECF subfamily)
MVERPGDEPRDSEIIRRVSGGDVNAFETLVHRYAPLVLGIVRRHVPGNKTEDVVQDTFVEAFRSLGSFSHKSPFSHWLSKIAVRCCYDFWRGYRGSSEIAVSSLSGNVENWLDHVQAARSREAFEREAAKTEAAEVLTYALAQLSPEDRVVLTLVHLDGRPIKEAAALLGWSAIAVKVRAHRSRKKLRNIISDLLGGRGAKT